MVRRVRQTGPRHQGERGRARYPQQRLPLRAPQRERGRPDHRCRAAAAEHQHQESGPGRPLFLSLDVSFCNPAARLRGVRSDFSGSDASAAGVPRRDQSLKRSTNRAQPLGRLDGVRHSLGCLGLIFVSWASACRALADDLHLASRAETQVVDVPAYRNQLPQRSAK